jgi:SNF2 family DNA or RNA helicase
MAKSYRHQAKAFELYKTQKAFAEWWEMGSGKTRTACEVAEYRLRTGMCNKIVIFAPKAVVDDHLWDREIARWTPNLTYSVVRGNRAHRIAALLRPVDIFIINYDVLTHMAQEMEGYITPETFIILDEATRIKRADAGRSKTARKMALRTQQICLMTGTPITNTLFDAWMLMFMLDRGATLGKTFWEFQNLYFEKSRWNKYSWKPRYQTAEKIHAALCKYGFFIKKADCIDLPDKTYRIIHTPMHPTTLEYYNKFRDDLILKIGDKEVKGQTVLAELIKAHQICNGFFIPTDHSGVMDLPNGKLDILLDMLENEMYGQQVIIWCTYRALIERIFTEIQKRLPDIKVRTLYGETPTSEREVLTRDWQRGDFKILVANQEVGGYGLNLTPCSIMIYFTNNYRVETRLQSQDRIHRPGATADKITIIDLVVPNSIDEVIRKSLNGKIGIANSIMSMKQMLGMDEEEEEDEDGNEDATDIDDITARQTTI